MTVPWQVRQGDVLIVRDDDAPIDGVEIQREGDRVVLAYGKATGHAHAIRTRTGKLHAVREAQAGVIGVLALARASTLRHEEHAPIRLPAGRYRIVRQVEYVAGAVPRPVAD